MADTAIRHFTHMRFGSFRRHCNAKFVASSSQHLTCGVLHRAVLYRMQSAAVDNVQVVEVWSRDERDVSVLKERLDKILGTRLLFPERYSDSQGSFDVDRFFSRLTTKTMGTTLLTAAQLPSTQEVLKGGIGEGRPDGIAVVAECQTEGIGRRGNTWTSPKGCLMFSTMTALQISGGAIPYLNYVVCLAIVNAIQDMSKECCNVAGVDVRIKWPNDIYYSGLKIGGVLLNASWCAGALPVCIGVGLNVFNREPTTCLATVFEEACESKLYAPILSEDLMAQILNHLEELLGVLKVKGFGPMKEQYLEHWLHTDQVLEIAETEDSDETMRVTVKGISPSGFLLAESEFGEQMELHPDGNGIDMMNGLIRKKI